MTDGPASTSRHGDLAELLTDEIRSGRFPVGTRFPTEMELQDRFGVGRHTIREALKLLAEQGMLGRRRKTGTVVLADRPVAPYVHSLRDLKGLLDFAQNTRLDIRHEGFVAISDGTIGGFTDLPDRRWYRIAGLRSTRSDGKPLCWSEILVPEPFKPDRNAIHSGSDAVYELVLAQNALKLDYVEQTISATDFPGEYATLLAAEAETAALMVSRRYVAHTGATFEVSLNLYPASRYSVRSVIRQRV
ncbi:GntR family transcriptional regulator [Thalassobaculum sp.]|uniref:GntR family transcriptional regulator n=1 Tax=Thalassobaculum sp. TaxID=2022740 RepID=UPI0032F02E19